VRQLRAQDRVNAVGSNDRRARCLLPVGKECGRALRVLTIPDTAAVEMYAIAVYRLKQNIEQRGTMYQRLCAAEREGAYEIVAAPGSDRGLGKRFARRPDRFGKPQIVERAKSVGPEHQPGTDFPQCVGAFIKCTGDTRPLQCGSGSQTPDTSANYDHCPAGYCVHAFLQAAE